MFVRVILLSVAERSALRRAKQAAAEGDPTALNAIKQAEMETKKTQQTPAKTKQKTAQSTSLSPSDDSSSTSNLNSTSHPFIMLIHRPDPNTSSTSHANQRFSNAAGWDIIVSAGWGKLLWKSLIYAGARAIGLRDRRSFLYENNILSFPEDYPDTVAGAMYERFVGTTLKLQYSRRPSNRRVNYDKYRVEAPFQSDWYQLTHTEQNADFKRKINEEMGFTPETEQKLDQIIKKPTVAQIEKKAKKMKTSNGSQKVTDTEMTDSEAKIEISSDSAQSTAATATPVIASNTKKRKQPEKPFHEDLLELKPVPYSLCASTLPFAVCRSFSSLPALSTSQLSLSPLSSSLLPVSVTMFSRGRPEDGAMIYAFNEEEEQQFKQYGKDWRGVLENIKAKTTRCSHRLIGRLSMGSFSLSTGHGTGIGMVRTSAFLEIAKRQQQQSMTDTETTKQIECMVLIRNVDSLAYRAAIIKCLIH